MRKSNPRYAAYVKRQNNNRPLKLSVKQMGEFIAKCRDAKDRTARFEQVKALSKVQPSPY